MIFEIRVIEKVKISSKKDQSLKQKRLNACVRLLRAPCDVQEEDKDLDDINVEGKSPEDIFLRADGVRSVSNEQLSVVGQKLEKEKSSVRILLCKCTKLQLLHYKCHMGSVSFLTTGNNIKSCFVNSPR